jgi:hypothetical protein
MSPSTYLCKKTLKSVVLVILAASVYPFLLANHDARRMGGSKLVGERNQTAVWLNDRIGRQSPE